MSDEQCNICGWFSEESESLVIHQGKYFTLFFPKIPMVYREDGGHLILIPNRHVVDVRFFTPPEIVEYMKFIQIASTVMYTVLPKIGIPIGRVNYHDNGNLEADKKIGAHQHLHIFGRSKESRQQIWKDNLRFPPWDPEDSYYRNSTHFSQSEKNEIVLHFGELFG